MRVFFTTEARRHGVRTDVCGRANYTPFIIKIQDLFVNGGAHRAPEQLRVTSVTPCLRGKNPPGLLRHSYTPRLVADFDCRDDAVGAGVDY